MRVFYKRPQYFLFFFILPLIFTTAAGAQENHFENAPPWLILEYGRKSFENREYGVALRYAREAIEKKSGYYPEAEILIGDVFAAESDYELAELQYKKALSMSHQLYILDEKYEIYYKLASLYEGKYPEKYVKTLDEIISADDMYQHVLETSMKDSFINILKTEGFDKLIVLYRLESYKSLEAHSKLGLYYYEQKDYKKSILHFIFSTVTVVSKCIEELKFHDPDYKFTDTETFFQDCRRFGLIQNYFQKSELFPNLFYLAAALEKIGTGKPIVRKLFTLVEEYSSNAVFIEKSRTASSRL